MIRAEEARIDITLAISRPGGLRGMAFVATLCPLVLWRSQRAGGETSFHDRMTHSFWMSRERWATDSRKKRPEDVLDVLEPSLPRLRRVRQPETA